MNKVIMVCKVKSNSIAEDKE